ncbi:3'-5' exoribonuclease [Spiroplasma chinense]|uniref:3'-5' exoribonuclease n=1 Tax=Spiroplasma chinense TaxID=216932 RepID=A0A5B9Y4X4_9MOLU|nr:HD domain-containing protein [Spiroplasma chinense]QEH62144.1 3'-5' exoribonuclease [Spiroplasma chinense]
MKICEINSEMKAIEVVARVERVILSTGNNGSNYLIINLVDNSGRIEARLWNSDERDVDRIKVDSILKIDGMVNVYRQQIQLKVNSYHKISKEEFEKYGIQEDMFAIAAPINIENSYKKLLDILDEIENEVYKKVTLSIIEEHEEQFKTYPAAMSIHHNVVGGLFWHSFSLLMGAKSLQPIYKFATIDWDLVFCGAILHDIGKVIEMKGKTAADYTDAGKMLGHISIGNAFISEKAKELNLNEQEYSEVIKLQHVVLSSHGKNEFGSPVEPVLIEGIIVSSLDAMDARIYKVNDEINKVDNGVWTSRIQTEDGRSFLNHYKK